MAADPRVRASGLALHIRRHGHPDLGITSIDGQTRQLASWSIALTARGRHAVTIEWIAGHRPQGGADMTRKRAGWKETKFQKAVSRRDLFKSGAAAGVSAAVLSRSGEALAQGI